MINHTFGGLSKQRRPTNRVGREHKPALAQTHAFMWAEVHHQSHLYLVNRDVLTTSPRRPFRHKNHLLIGIPLRMK